MSKIVLSQSGRTIDALLGHSEIGTRLLGLMPFTLQMARWDAKEYLSVIIPPAVSNTQILKFLESKRATLLIQDNKINLLIADSETEGQFTVFEVGEIIGCKDTTLFNEGKIELTFTTANFEC